MSVMPKCANCPLAYCQRVPLEMVKKDTLPEFCPMKTSEGTIKKVIERYGKDDVKRIYVPATITEKEAYECVRGVRMAVRPRIKELIEFGKLIHANKIGMAFCAGMRDEAKRIMEFLEKSGFSVASVLCKCGGIDKTRLHVEKEYKIDDPLKFEAGCNPVLQAQLLNDAKTDINVIVGLCLGHDMLFTMNSKAPVTTLIVKDRLLGHNPVIALYSNYHKGIMESQKRT
ncbi:MAG TPA: DUF1847 domain-containing protein [Patescibacteria group bacterium]|nr:DUF1847 domain-containing protein [Patescibacteria group bacterium]